MTAGAKITTEHTGTNVLTVRVSGNAGAVVWVLLSGDRHHDNPHTRHDLERKHLDEARERGAGIIDWGDLFCAMQGKYDKRSSKSSVRPENQTDRYLDSLVDCAADFYSPYAKNFWVIGRGNHESSIKNRHETDLTDRLVHSLNGETGSTIQAGGYTGWVRFLFNRQNTRYSSTLWYGHGWGGGGPVTINTIQAANRMPMMLDGVDILCTGHVHEAWHAEKIRACLNDAGRVQHKTIHVVQGATYKEEYGTGHGGWHVETGKPPKPLGAWWLKFTMRTEGVDTEILRAN